MESRTVRQEVSWSSSTILAIGSARTSTDPWRSEKGPTMVEEKREPSRVNDKIWR